MRNTTRSIILSLLMVTSVFAGSIALAGTAAAAPTNDDVTNSTVNGTTLQSSPPAIGPDGTVYVVREDRGLSNVSLVGVDPNGTEIFSTPMMNYTNAGIAAGGHKLTVNDDGVVMVQTGNADNETAWFQTYDGDTGERMVNLQLSTGSDAFSGEVRGANIGLTDEGNPIVLQSDSGPNLTVLDPTDGSVVDYVNLNQTAGVGTTDNSWIGSYTFSHSTVIGPQGYAWTMVYDDDFVTKLVRADIENGTATVVTDTGYADLPFSQIFFPTNDSVGYYHWQEAETFGIENETQLGTVDMTTVGQGFGRSSGVVTDGEGRWYVTHWFDTQDSTTKIYSNNVDMTSPTTSVNTSARNPESAYGGEGQTVQDGEDIIITKNGTLISAGPGNQVRAINPDGTLLWNLSMNATLSGVTMNESGTLFVTTQTDKHLYKTIQTDHELPDFRYRNFQETRYANPPASTSSSSAGITDDPDNASDVPSSQIANGSLNVPNGSLKFSSEDTNTSDLSVNVTANDENNTNISITRSDGANATNFFVATDYVNATSDVTNTTVFVNGSNVSTTVVTTDNGTDYYKFQISDFSTKEVTFAVQEDSDPMVSNPTDGPIFGLPAPIGTIGGIPFWVLGVLVLGLGGAAYWYRQREMSVTYE